MGTPDGFRIEGFGLGYVVLAGALSGVFLGMTRRSTTRPGFALRLGLLYEIVLGYVLALGSTAQEAARHGHVPYLTWATALVITFPLIVPSPPRTTLVTALITATGSPVAAVVCARLGLLHVPASAYLEVSVSPIIGTVIAYFGSNVVYGLNLDYAAAKRAGSYTLVSKLETGGMGEVWRAEHRMLARPAAVKLIRRDRLEDRAASAEGAVERFRREAQAIAMLRSPNTVEIYDYGVSDDGSFYYVMELLDGLDLESLVRRYGPVPPARAIHFLIQAAGSLAEAHANDLIHRDIKPANLFLCQYGLASDFIKVLDFGLVKAQHEPLGGELESRTDTLKGTPAFMSPEQITGHPLEPASDIYSLGCVGYWLLTGRLPFEERTVLAVMAQHVSSPPPSPSETAPMPVPPELDTFIVSCLAKDPAARPQSMLILEDALEKIAREHPWTREQAAHWWREHGAEIVTQRSSDPAATTVRTSPARLAVPPTL